MARIDQVILAAPDIDQHVFENFARDIRGISNRVTLYASANDVALKASGSMARGLRAGDVPPSVVAGIDFIDVTRLATDIFSLNHSSYAENTALMNDIKLVIMEGEPPNVRAPILQKVLVGTGFYWKW